MKDEADDGRRRGASPDDRAACRIYRPKGSDPSDRTKATWLIADDIEALVRAISAHGAEAPPVEPERDE